MNSHIHKFKIECKRNDYHIHIVNGYVENMLGVNNFHVHYYYGVSSYTNHTHYFSGLSGLPIKTENGHIHEMEGILAFNFLHEHMYSGYTFEEVSYISGKAYGEAYI